MRDIHPNWLMLPCFGSALLIVWSYCASVLPTLFRPSSWFVRLYHSFLLASITCCLVLSLALLRIIYMMYSIEEIGTYYRGPLRPAARRGFLNNKRYYFKLLYNHVSSSLRDLCIVVHLMLWWSLGILSDLLFLLRYCSWSVANISSSLGIASL